MAQHRAAAQRDGIELRHGAAVEDLLRGDDGAFTGVAVRNGDGTRAELEAGAVVLAAGGFESNPQMRAAQLGPNWDVAKVRGTPHNTGEVLRAALAHGAQAYGHWSGCHAIQWDAGAPPTGDRELTNRYSRQSYPVAIVVNADGERFIDEGADFRNYTYAKYGAEVLRQPQGIAAQIFDANTVQMLRTIDYEAPGATRVDADTLAGLAEAAEHRPRALRAHRRGVQRRHRARRLRPDDQGRQGDAGHRPAQVQLGAAGRAAAVHRVPDHLRDHLHLRRRARGRGRPRARLRRAPAAGAVRRGRAGRRPLLPQLPRRHRADRRGGVRAPRWLRCRAMKAIVWQGPEQMTIEERPDPGDPGAGELIVRPQAVGICGSEVEGYLGHMDNRTPPLVMGHEFAGVVVAAGADAARPRGHARRGQPAERLRALPAVRRRPLQPLPRPRPDRRARADGAFADFVRAPAASARVLPDDVSARTGALVEPLANGVHAVRLGLAHATVERAVVLGAGTIGLVTLQAALLAGIEHVALLEPQPQRRERAAALGAHATYGSEEEALEAERAATDGLGTDLVLDAVGAQATREPRAAAAAAGRARWSTSASPPTTRRSASTTSCAASSRSRGPTRTRWTTSRWRSSGSSAARRRSASWPTVRPLDDGPGAFAALAGGPPPAEVKVFLAGAGRET